jgi:hypothetical protein
MSDDASMSAIALNKHNINAIASRLPIAIKMG